MTNDRIPLSIWVVLAAVAGILAGIVFRDRTSVLIPVGSADGERVTL
jgi:Na+/H+-dicarboxylate symporter